MPGLSYGYTWNVLEAAELCVPARGILSAPEGCQAGTGGRA